VEPPEKTVEEIQWEAEEEIARAAHLARDAERGKRNNGLQDDSGAYDDEPRVVSARHRGHRRGLICYSKLFVGLPIFISQ
jgi:hypothetical protein